MKSVKWLAELDDEWLNNIYTSECEYFRIRWSYFFELWALRVNDHNPNTILVFDNIGDAFLAANELYTTGEYDARY